MAQLVCAGPPVSFANFRHDFAQFRKLCEGPTGLNRFRSYRPVITKPLVIAAI
jgi:hypothetical protein